MIGGSSTCEAVPQQLECSECSAYPHSDKAGARVVLEAMAQALPVLAAVQYELGLLLDPFGERRVDNAVRRISRASSSIEWPWWAARRRNLAFR